MSDSPAIAETFATALAWHRQGRLAEAEAAYRRVLALDAAHADAWHLLGVAALQAGRAAEAARCIQRALEIRPAFAEAYSNLGAAFHQQRAFDEAIACHQKALELHPGYSGAYANLGNTFRELACFKIAAACYSRALELDPSAADIWFSLGSTLKKDGQLAAAADAYRRTIALRPGDAEAHNNLGNVLTAAGDLAAAHGSYGEALRLAPEHSGAHFNRAVWLLLQGQWEEGWQEFEHRLWRAGAVRREFSQPRWNGGDLAGRTILLYAEQGLGDTIQFIRYVPLVRALGGPVIVECQRPLVPLLSRSIAADALYARGAELPAFDWQAPLASLPGIFGTRSETVPRIVPYLSADERLVAEWRQRLSSLPGRRIGICWQGNPDYADDRFRSIPLGCFAPLSTVPGVHLISLQKGRGSEQVAEARQIFPMQDWSGELDESAGAFMDTAALMKSLDLVITSDTSVAHLAGALGVRVWVALPKIPDWRWLLDRPDSPWYPTMRLFRQQRPGDWPGVLAAIRRELHSGR